MKLNKNSQVRPEGILLLSQYRIKYIQYTCSYTHNRLITHHTRSLIHNSFHRISIKMCIHHQIPRHEDKKHMLTCFIDYTKDLKIFLCQHYGTSGVRPTANDVIKRTAPVRFPTTNPNYLSSPMLL